MKLRFRSHTIGRCPFGILDAFDCAPRWIQPPDSSSLRARRTFLRFESLSPPARYDARVPCDGYAPVPSFHACFARPSRTSLTVAVWCFGAVHSAHSVASMLTGCPSGCYRAWMIWPMMVAAVHTAAVAPRVRGMVTSHHGTGGYCCGSGRATGNGIRHACFCWWIGAGIGNDSCIYATSPSICSG